ncbi:MAG TPA: DUF721 domain-containing protein [Polyangiaceae bacterium]|nr:DUF721 domain-containing protein [Polyangiaceae bacterium]
MKRSGGKRRDPSTVGALLHASGRLRPRNDRIDRDRWRSLLGERIGERTRPGMIRDECLTVYVASAVWAQELTFLSPMIVERLAADGFPVTALRFRVGDVGEPLSKRPPVTKREAPPKAELPPGLTERLAHVDDPALRAAIAEAAAYALGRAAATSAERRASRGLRSAAPKTDPQGPSPPPPNGARGGTGGKHSR